MANQLTNIDYKSFIQIHHNQPVTTSINIASAFNKLHKNILQKIDALSQEIPKEWYELNFKPIQISVDLGQKRTRQDRAFEISKDGFVLLVMGFTGKVAMQIKIAYINAFNQMSNILFGEAMIYLARNKPSTIQNDVYYLQQAFNHLAVVQEIYLNNIDPALKQLNSPFRSKLYERIIDSTRHVKRVLANLKVQMPENVLPKP